LVANAASFVLPISNPANLVVFGNQVPRLGKWLHSFALPSLLSIAVTYAAIRWLFRKDIDSEMEKNIGVRPLDSGGRFVLCGIAAMTAVLLMASACGKDLGLPTCLAALAVTVLVSIIGRSNPLPLVREISWQTLALVAGLFVMVDAIENVGGMEATKRLLVWAQNLGSQTATLVVGFTVGLANNLVNNLPLGLIVGGSVRSAHMKGPILDAALIGVDLGPNLSITGSLATILWLIALRKEKIQVSFWDFFKVGVVAMPAALLAALIGAALMRFFSPSM
jgi:arsenical pump membrane protein